MVVRTECGIDRLEAIEVVVQGARDEQVYRDIALVRCGMQSSVQILRDSYGRRDAGLLIELRPRHGHRP
jgi:hypothetical protein